MSALSLFFSFRKGLSLTPSCLRSLPFLQHIMAPRKEVSNFQSLVPPGICFDLISYIDLPLHLLSLRRAAPLVVVAMAGVAAVEHEK